MAVGPVSEALQLPDLRFAPYFEDPSLTVSVGDDSFVMDEGCLSHGQ